MDLDPLIAHATALAPASEAGPQPVSASMPDLLLLRQPTPGAFESTLYEPVLCLILQGSKEVSIGEHTHLVGPGDCLLVSHDVPVRSRVTRAPYLALILRVDLELVRGLYSEVTEPPADPHDPQAVATHRADAGLLDALGRYLALARAPDLPVLGPLIRKELHYRLLTAPLGGMLRSLRRPDSIASAVSRAIAHLRRDLRTPTPIPALARQVGMSPSALHKHFKTITATTPLQYQKELRLLEARRLLTTSATSVSAAAYDVGYESPNQFSREYTRKFGVPPSQHLAQR